MWAEQMGFLKPFLAMAATHTNIHSDAPSNSERSPVNFDAEIEQELDGMEERNNGGQLELPAEPLAANERADVPNSTAPKSATSFQMPNRTASRKRVRSSDASSTSAVDKVLDYLKQTDETPQADLDYICLGYAKTIRKFSSRRQAETKFLISKLLMEKELEELNDAPPQSQYHSSSPNYSTNYSRTSPSYSNHSQSSPLSLTTSYTNTHSSISPNHSPNSLNYSAGYQLSPNTSSLNNYSHFENEFLVPSPQSLTDQNMTTYTNLT